MNDSNHDNGADVAALRKRTVDGEPYARPTEIETLLAILVSIDEEEALSRARIRRRSAPGWLPGECLIHMLRRAGRRRDKRSYNRWCTLVLERIRAALPRTGDDAASPRDLERVDYVLDRFVSLLGPDLEDYEMRLDIWEARFDLALANLRRDAFRREATPEESGEAVSIDDDAALRAEVERATAVFHPFAPQASDEAEEDFRLRVWAAIETLPTEQNRILTMMREGVPVGSGAAGEVSMSGVLDRTPRTILNHKLRALDAVRRIVRGDDK
jgi:hypothetical protein